MDSRGNHHLIGRNVIKASDLPSGYDGDIVVIRSLGFDWPKEWYRTLSISSVNMDVVELLAI